MSISQIDLNFMGKKGIIATYLIMHSSGVLIVDPGPETCLPVLIDALDRRGLTPSDVTSILVTHIHLDHAGAAGWFASQGAQVFVHPVGIPHIRNPEKLIASARRLYGNWMEKLWGEMKPVSVSNLVGVEDNEEILVGEVCIRVIHTAGHAAHHVVYICGDTLFTGDVGGVRFIKVPYVRLPFVPPETDLEAWRDSLQRMRDTGCDKIAPAHFGIYYDACSHLNQASCFLDAVEAWMEHNMPFIPDVDALSIRYADFLHAHGTAAGLNEDTLAEYDGGNPVSFAASGLFRYWQKVRN